MNNVVKALVFFALWVGGQAYAANVDNITIKAAGFITNPSFTAFVFSSNENVVLEGCSVPSSWQFAQPTSPDTRMTTIASMILAAQAQGLKVNVFYSGCNALFGPTVESVFIHR